MRGSPAGIGPYALIVATLEDADEEENPPAAGSSPQRQGIQSVEIAMTVLHALEASGGPTSLTQLAARSGMQPSKIHRYLVSLSRVGLVSQSPTSSLYDLGPSLRRLGAEALRRMDEVGIASEYLPALRDQTGQAVNMAVWGDQGPVVIRWAYGAHALPITVRVGATLPILTSSVGRVYLTYLPATLTRPLIRAQRSALQPGGISDSEIEEIKASVLQQGYASTSGGVIPGIYSIAAPVFTTGDMLPLVVSVALPSRIITPTVIRTVTGHLLEITRAMSEDLGYAGEYPNAADHDRKSP